MVYKILINVSGKVQEVGFKDTISRYCNEKNITGYVKNLSNGTVDVVGEGSESELKELVEYISMSPGYSSVKSTKVSWTDPTNRDYKDFQVKL